MTDNRRPYKGANVRYQAGPTRLPGYSHPAIIVSVGYVGWKKDESYRPAPGEVLCDFPGGAPTEEGPWLEVCTLAVFTEHDGVKTYSLIPYSPQPAEQHWNWPEANPDYPCQNCGHMPGRAPTESHDLRCPNCGAG